MDVIHPRCAGLDISKKDAKVCVRINGAGRRRTSETVTTFGATTRQIMAMRDHLAAQQVTCIVMEATGDYWKPFYYLLEDLPGVEVMLVNARHVKNLPGRKTSETVTTFGATTRQIMAMRDHLAAQRVTCVVMEATGDYVRSEGA